MSPRKGFEHTQADRIAFRVRRLNQSARQGTDVIN